MIGVLPKPNQLRAVQELFELFKTPWELYARAGSTRRRRDGIRHPRIDAPLALIFGAEAKSLRCAAEVRSRHAASRRTSRSRRTIDSIYGNLLDLDYDDRRHLAFVPRAA